MSAATVESFVSPETGLRWGYTTDGYVWCDDCGGRVMWKCTACGGASYHWCDLDRAAMDGRGDYCDWPIDCDVCENTGMEGCRTCEG
jgi:hypothetical protein